MESDDYVPQFSQLAQDPSSVCLGYSSTVGQVLHPSVADSYIPPTPCPPYGYSSAPQPPVAAPPPPIQQYPAPPPPKGKGSKKKNSPKGAKNQQQPANLVENGPRMVENGPPGYSPAYQQQPNVQYGNYQPQAMMQQQNPSYGMVQQPSGMVQQQGMSQQQQQQMHYQQQQMAYQQQQQQPMYKNGPQQQYDQSPVRYQQQFQQRSPQFAAAGPYHSYQQQMRAAAPQHDMNVQYPYQQQQQQAQAHLQQQQAAAALQQQQQPQRPPNAYQQHYPGQYQQQTSFGGGGGQQQIRHQMPPQQQYSYQPAYQQQQPQSSQYPQPAHLQQQPAHQMNIDEQVSQQVYRNRSQMVEHHVDQQQYQQQQQWKEPANQINPAQQQTAASYGPGGWAYQQQMGGGYTNQQQAPTSIGHPSYQQQTAAGGGGKSIVTEMDIIAKRAAAAVVDTSSFGPYAKVLSTQQEQQQNSNAPSQPANQQQTTPGGYSAANNPKHSVPKASPPPPPPPRPQSPALPPVSTSSPIVHRLSSSPAAARYSSGAVECARYSGAPAEAARYSSGPAETARYSGSAADGARYSEAMVNPAYQNHIVAGSTPTSLAVVMPSDHRGPAVQLNIQPNSQPTTLITLYQLPPGAQHPTPQQLMSNQAASAAQQHLMNPTQQQTMVAAAQRQTPMVSPHLVVPQEPTPKPLPPPPQPIFAESHEMAAPKFAPPPPMESLVMVPGEAAANVVAEIVEQAAATKKPKKPKKKREVPPPSSLDAAEGLEEPPAKKRKKAAKKAKKVEPQQEEDMPSEEPTAAPIVVAASPVATEETTVSAELADVSTICTSSFNNNSNLFRLPPPAEAGGENSQAAVNGGEEAASELAVDEEAPPKAKKKKAAKKSKASKDSKPKITSKYAQKVRVRKKKKKASYSEESEDEKAGSQTSAAKKRAAEAKAAAVEVDTPTMSVDVSMDNCGEKEEELNFNNFAETRRSNRLTKRKKYNEDWDLDLDAFEREAKDGDSGLHDESLDNSILEVKDPAAAYFFLENPKEEDSLVVEKLLAVRCRQVKSDEADVDAKEVEEFFVKYKNFSYLHCNWKTADELEKGDKRVQPKIKRFRLKHQQALFLDEFDEDEPINPDFITVDRVLDVSTSIIPAEAPSRKCGADLRKDSPKKEVDERNSKEIQVKQEEALEEEKVEDEEEKHEASIEKEAETVGNAKSSEFAVVANASGDVATKVEANGEDSTRVEESGEMGSVGKSENGEISTTKSENGENSMEREENRTETEEKSAPTVATHYLVKWRGLPYEECTWELECDVDPNKIQEFLVRRNPPEREKLGPKSDEWKKVPDNVEYKNGNTLRDYQLEGINWLLFCWFNKQNCILADEMGLGKTIQSITFLIEVANNNVRGPFLVIAPLSTIMNWQREFENWSDLNSIVYHGTFASRRMIQEYEMFYKNEKGEKIGSYFKFNVLITTYEMILMEVELLKEIPWRCVIIDEAHRLKNRNCKLMVGLSQFKMEHRVLLTGTPLQNNIEELFSLLNFLEPKQFCNSQMFLEEFGTLQSDDQVQQLQVILKPMMLRRLKEDVEKSLKPKEETIIEVELTNIQKKYYRAILERNFAYLSRGSAVPSLMNTMMELRKCCNHPFLINGAEEQILLEFRAAHSEMSEDQVYQQGMVQSSGKLVLIDKLLPRLRADGHKVLVFSQMVRCLDILEDYLVNRKYPFERIDGNVRGDMRQAAIDRFCNPQTDRFVFLLCTRAGGLGINLTAADTVIIFDSDWNPQNDLQAQARCHRIGQDKFVKVYRLICRNSYEREMFDKASLKLGLDKAVLQSNNKENLSAQLSKKEIEELLRKGAYGALMDETNEGDAFCEEDIDQILQRRTQTVTIQPGVKGSTFAKASFAVSGNRSDIDVNDPNFWQMWARKANIDTDFNHEKDLIIYEPRQRKRRFDDQVYEMANQNSDESGGGESDSDTGSESGRGKNRRKKNRGASNAGKDDDAYYGPDELAFSKSDYFRIEKFLSTYGWGRWKDILKHCSFKQSVSENDAKSMCRTVLLHCLRQYNGDEKIKEFIWELISPPEDGAGKTYDDMKNHQGLFGPVPRGRKTRKTGKNDLMSMYHQGWASMPVYNPPALAVDYGYQRHLQRHSNKVLLRVRLLYYLEHEVINELGDEILAGANASEVDLNPPWHPEVPAPWWDKDADKSLLIGLFKHGFESFDEIRADPTLCFLSRCGPPGINANIDSQAPNLKEAESDGEKKASRSCSRKDSKEEDSFDEEMREIDAKSVEPPSIEAEEKLPNACGGDAEGPAPEALDLLPFPSAAELNGRFRRLITLYQRTTKVSLAKEESKAKRAARQEQMQAIMQEREMKKLEERQRWSRREEGDFYRALISFGVERDGDEYNWERFKHLARLETKFDDTLTEYYNSFLAMCKRVCRKSLTKEEECMSYLPEALTEERAGKVLQRIDFMARIRSALVHPKFDERIKSAKRTPDLPVWWEVGQHDAELLKGVAKHGLVKTEENIVPDREFSFFDVWKCLQNESASSAPSRAITRTYSRMSGGRGGREERDASPTKEKDSAELVISQILAHQTGGSAMQWPKERAVIFRIQSLCHLIEKGEWTSSSRSFATLMDLDQRSNTPDTPGLASTTPGPSDDAPLLANDSHASPASSAGGGAASGSFKLPSGAQPDFSSLFAPRGGGRRGGGGGGRGRKRANPLQDLMEGERERMRALMHQSFLHQLEQFPFGLPLAGGKSSNGLDSASTSTSGNHNSKSSGVDEGILNLSTKQKKQEAKEKKGEKCGESKSSPFGGESFPLGNLSPDTRVPVINLRDGTRLTGKDAPTLKNLTQFLFENQHFMIDMMSAATTADRDSSSPYESELEPGEIARGSRTNASSSTPTTVDANEHVTVVNRKNGLKLSGVKAPQLRNLSMWLDKNPDWDVDVGSAELGKVKGKLLAKVKNRLADSRQSSPPAPSVQHIAASSSSANAATPPATMSSAAALDPWSSFLTSGGVEGGGLNFNDPFQMSLLFPFAAANPSLLAAGFGGMPFGFPSGGGFPMMSTSSACTTSTSSKSKEASSSSSKKENSKSDSSSKSHQKAAAAAAANAAAEQMAAAAAAASMNPFLFGGLSPAVSTAAGSGGIFGLNPFLTSGGAGLLPGFGMSPNFAAMAQLQALMGFQNMDAELSSPPTTSTSQTTPQAKTSTKSPQSSNSIFGTSSSKNVKKSSNTSHEPTTSSSGGGGGRKLNALVNKLVSSKTSNVDKK